MQRVSIVFTDCPFTFDMESFVIPIVACTCDIADSKLAAVVTDAVPKALTPAVTGNHKIAGKPVRILHNFPEL